MDVTVVADQIDADAGYVGERLAEVGAELRFVDRDRLPRFDRLGQTSLLLLLGSGRSAGGSENADVVGSESALVRDALDAATPVLGICYGAQLLAHALGGEVSPAPAPEIGSYAIDSYDPVLCPPGPWMQLHSDVFAPPPGARTLGASASGCQGFADESRRARALGWQFHPEVTAERFTAWVHRLRDLCARIDKVPEALEAEVRQRDEQNRRAAHALTDAALAYLR